MPQQVPRKTGEVYQIRNVPNEQTLRAQDIPNLTRALVIAFRGIIQEQNALLARLTTRLDRLEGLNGTPTFFHAVDANQFPLKNLADPVDARDAQIKELSLAVDRSTGQYTALGKRITEGAEALDAGDFVTLSQLRTSDALHSGPVNLSDTVHGVTGVLAIGNGGTGQNTQTAAFNALDPLTTKGDVIIHDGTNSVRVPVGTNGQLFVADSTASPGVAWKGTVQTYTPTNVTTDRSYDANATTLDEIADIIGTLIADLKTFGILT